MQKNGAKLKSEKEVFEHFLAQKFHNVFLAQLITSTAMSHAHVRTRSFRCARENFPTKFHEIHFFLVTVGIVVPLILPTRFAFNMSKTRIWQYRISCSI